MSEKKEEKTPVRPDFVKWFSELNKNSGNVAGGKGANLAEIYNLKLPVPPGFVVTAQAYDYFIHKAGIDEEIKEILGKINYEDTEQLTQATKEIRELILKSEIPAEMQEEIIEAYETLDTEKIEKPKGKNTALDILKSSAEPIFVAVRSSATTEDLADASFAGQQDSFVNVKGKTELINHIKKCFASLFTARATYYRNKKGFKHEQASLAVVVQKMVDSDKSGVIFSKDPSYKKDNVIIEAVFGLGEGIVSGKITPDKYLVSSQLEIIDKKIADKKIALTRDSGGRKISVKLKPETSTRQVLETYEIKQLAQHALKLEEHYKKPQDIEFAIENKEIYIVQTRPITTIEKRIDASEKKEIKGEVILEGLAASPGIASGKIRVIKDLADLPKIKQGDVFVTEMTNPDMVVSMQKSAAIVTNEGGMTAHAAIVSREIGIPCVVGTQTATEKLKEGEIITVDGFTGKIYKGKVAETVQKEVLPVEAQTKTKIKVIIDLPSSAQRAAKSKIKQAGLTRLEGIIAESGKHPNYFLKNKKTSEYEEIIFKGVQEIAKYFDELWIRTSDIRSDEFSNLEGAPEEKEPNPMLGFHGIRYSLKNPEIFKAELNALKKISEQGKKIGLLLPQVISVKEIQETKKILREINFANPKLGVMIETPASVQIIRELCEEKIDFISFGTNDLTQYTLAIDRNNENVQYLYNETDPAILNQLKYVIRTCKRNNVETSICGQAGSKKQMVKFLVEQGIESISVNADAAAEIAQYVSELESGEKIEKPLQEKNPDLDKQEEKIEKELVEVEKKQDEQEEINLQKQKQEKIEKLEEEIQKEKQELEKLSDSFQKKSVEGEEISQEVEKLGEESSENFQEKETSETNLENIQEDKKSAEESSTDTKEIEEKSEKISGDAEKQEKIKELEEEISELEDEIKDNEDNKLDIF